MHPKHSTTEADSDDEKFINSMSDNIAKDTAVYVGDLSQMLNTSTPNFKDAINNVLGKDQISWGYKLFQFDLIYAAIKHETDESLKIYKIDNYTETVDTTITDFLNADSKHEFWETELKKYTKKSNNTNSIFALALQCNAYHLNFKGIIPSIQEKSIPFWMTVSLDGNHAEFQLLFGQIPLVNEHIFIKHCIGSISLSSISIKGLVYVFGLNLNGELALTNGFEANADEESLSGSVTLSLKVFSAKDDRLSYSAILNHWKKHFPEYSLLFDVLKFVYSNTQIVNFKCTLKAAITGTLSQTETGKNKQKENEDTKAEEEATEREKKGKKPKDKAPSGPVKYSIDLEFQPQIDPEGAIGTILKLLQMDDSVKELQELFPLKLYLSGDNEDGYALGAKVEKRIDIRKWVFAVIYFDNLTWSGGIEYKTEDKEVVLKAQASLFGMIKLNLPGLAQVAMSGTIGAQVNLMDPTSAEIGIGFCVKFGDEKGWDPFTLVDLESGFNIKSLSMGMSITAECIINIMCATTFSFLDNDVIVAIKFAIDVPKECAYPKAFHFTQDGEIELRKLFEALCPVFPQFEIAKVPDIKVKNAMFSCGIEETEIVYDIEFKADTEDDDDNENKKAILMADALNNLDKYHMANKVLTIKKGLAMKGEITICDVITIEGELVMSTEMFKMRVHFHAEEDKMEKFKKQIYDELQQRLYDYEMTLFDHERYEVAMKVIAKVLNKATLGFFDLVTGDGDAFFEAALEWGFQTAQLITMKIFQIVKDVIKFILDNISIYEFLYHLQISSDALPIFKFKINMRIGDIRIVINIDTEKDFSIKKFFEMLLDTEFWGKLIKNATQKARELIGSLAKKILGFLWKCIGGEWLVNWWRERQRRIKEAEELRRAFEKDMAKLRNKMKENRQRFITEQFAECKSSISKMSKMRDEINTVLPKIQQRMNDIDAQLIAENERIKGKLQDIDDEIRIVEEKYKKYDDKIKQVINKTNVDESIVCTFLKVLNDGLLFALMQHNDSKDTLYTKMKVNMNYEYELSIEEWFGLKQLSRFIPILNTLEDYKDMQDILDGYDDFCEAIDVGIQAHNGTMDSFDDNEKELLAKWCDEEYADKTWMKYEDDKRLIIARSLSKTIPILIEFLDHIVGATDVVSRLLNYDKHSNDDQIAAVKNEKENKEKWIKLNGNYDNGNDGNDDDEKKQDNNIQYLKEKQLTNIDDIDNIKKTCDAIEIAAKIEISFVETLRNEYNVKKTDIDPLQLESILQLASTIEYCCCDMIEKQCMVRKSVLLAQRLIDFKPLTVTSDAKPLWDVITEGIKDIYSNAKEMAKISAEFFSLFTKLKIGFETFMSNIDAKLKDNDDDEKETEVHLSLALHDAQTYRREFVDFGEKKIKPVMDKLKQSTEIIVANCIKKSKACGGDSVVFGDAIKARENAETLYLEKREEFNSVRFKFSDKYQELRVEHMKVLAEYESQSWNLQYLEDAICKEEQYLEDLKTKQT